MNLFVAVVVAGAVQFCSTTPDDPLCAAREIAPVEMTAERWAIVSSVAAEGLDNYRPELGQNDEWNPDARRRDCDDQVLWQLREYARRDPVLFAAARPVIVLVDRQGRTQQGHLLVAIETTDGVIVIDRRDTRSLTHGPSGRGVVHRWNSAWRGIAPQRGMGGRWVAYEP